MMKYFSFEGRAGRQEWWICTLITTLTGLVSSVFAAPAFGYLMAILIMMTFGADLSGEEFPLGAMLGASVALVLLVLSSYLYCAVSVRRYHDRGKSGWWFLIGLVPLIGWLWQLIELGFLGGTSDGNTYGPTVASGNSSPVHAPSSLPTASPVVPSAA